MPLSAVPAHTFSLNAPATAQVVREASSPQATQKGVPDDSVVKTAAVACNTTPQAFGDAMQAGDKSMLAICRETSPTMTADRLVDALIVPIKATLDGQVASGAITAGEEATDLANIRVKLTHMVSDQPGTAPGAKQP
jgi:hypothetical protein